MQNKIKARRIMKQVVLEKGNSYRGNPGKITIKHMQQKIFISFSFFSGALRFFM